MLVHNIGAGTRLEDRLFDFEIRGATPVQAGMTGLFAISRP
jgi:hypothetical protein